MQKINVIDLDNTLLPYDSFGRFVKNEIKKIDLYVGFITGLRVTRIISPAKFKQILTAYWGRKYDSSFFNNYAKLIYQDLDKRVLKIVQSKTDSKTTNILISASPELYIKKLIALLQWDGSGSYFVSNRFIHLYSEKKIKWLSDHYPETEYIYNFSISDSHSDDHLLELFKESIFWVN